ncbi:MAG: response regulator transcription factor [Deltaproteobacteria bacterium]|nr:MAG: response regulator transcription factor [Deltaproteobacteria bacterium]
MSLKAVQNMSEGLDTRPVPSPTRTICIVGPNRVQNDLIATCLEKAVGAICRVGRDIAHTTFPDDLKLYNQSKMVLCDYQGVDIQGFLVDLKSNGSQKVGQDYVVLFNVNRGHGIEKKYVWEGVRGVFYEQDPLALFLKGVEAVLNGELWLPREIMAKCILEGSIQDDSSQEECAVLSIREVEILALVSVGVRNGEIADKLCISPHTVKTHLYNIFKKINVPNRLQAALWAAKHL